MISNSRHFLRILTCLMAVAIFCTHQNAAAVAHEFEGSMPSALLDDSDALHVVYIGKVNGESRVQYRQIVGDTKKVVSLSGEGVALSHWSESPPTIARTDDGALHVVFTAKTRPAERRSPIELRYRRSLDNGETWALYSVVGEAERETYRACASMSPISESSIFVSWLEGRERGVGLATTRIDDGKTGRPTNLFDDKSCECCGTELLASSGGELFLAYRDLGSGNVRDIHLARGKSGDATLAPAKAVSWDRWKLNGCPDTGPSMAMDPAGRLWVSWYTGNPSGIFSAVSQPDGTEFSDRVSIAKSDNDVQVANPDLGILPGGSVVVAYEAMGQDAVTIELKRWSDAEDAWFSAETVGADGSDPFIVSNGDRALVGFVRNIDGQTTVVLTSIK